MLSVRFLRGISPWTYFRLLQQKHLFPSGCVQWTPDWVHYLAVPHLQRTHWWHMTCTPCPIPESPCPGSQESLCHRWEKSHPGKQHNKPSWLSWWFSTCSRDSSASLHTALLIRFSCCMLPSHVTIPAYPFSHQGALRDLPFFLHLEQGFSRWTSLFLPTRRCFPKLLQLLLPPARFHI